MRELEYSDLEALLTAGLITPVENFLFHYDQILPLAITSNDSVAISDFIRLRAILFEVKGLAAKLHLNK